MSTSTSPPRSDETSDRSGLASFTSSVDHLRPWAATAVRVAMGALLLVHGLDKFDTGLDNVGMAFDGWGVPLPEASAWFVAVFEVVGGLALIVGLATRAVAALMALVLVGAIVFAKGELGVIGGYETDVAYIAALVAIVFAGPGMFSVDEALKIEAPPA